MGGVVVLRGWVRVVGWLLGLWVVCWACGWVVMWAGLWWVGRAGLWNIRAVGWVGG